MMKVSINKLEEDVFNASPIYRSPDVKVLLRITVDKSYFISFSSILKSAIRDFELKCPLFMSERKILVQGLPSFNGYVNYTFINNYDAFEKGILTEDRLELIPTAVVSMGPGFLSQPRRVNYNAPTARFRSSGQFTVNYLTKYPVRLYKHKSEDEFADTSHIYGISEESGGKYHFLIDMIEYKLCMWLRDQKSQINFNELPMEILSSVETRLSELETRINDLYQNSAWYSNLYW